MTRLAMVLCALPLAAQNWPQFRGVEAKGIADGQNPPAQFDAPAGKNLAWKAAIPGLGHSSPIIWGDRVFVTTAISSDPKPFRHGLYGDVEPSNDVARHTWKVYCLDRKNGKIIWERVAYEGIPKTKRHPKSSQASSTPVTNGKLVIALFGSEGMYAYDLDGKLKWKADLGVLNAGWFYDPDYEWAHGSSPIIYKDTVIVQADIAKDSFIAAYSLKDGKQVWRTARKEVPSWATPTVVRSKDRVELVANGTKAIRGYDPDTGKELWWFNGNNSEITVTPPVESDGLIYLNAGYPPVQPIYAFKTGLTGDVSLKQGEESNSAMAWGKKRGGTYIPAPLIYNGQLYVLSINGVLASYNARTGERIYQERLTKEGSAHSAALVAADGRIYCGTEDGDVFVVKAGPKYELISKSAVGEPVMATPAVGPGMLIVRAENHLFAFSSEGQPE